MNSQEKRERFLAGETFAIIPNSFLCCLGSKFRFVASKDTYLKTKKVIRGDPGHIEEGHRPGILSNYHCNVKRIRREEFGVYGAIMGKFVKVTIRFDQIEFVEVTETVPDPLPNPIVLTT